MKIFLQLSVGLLCLIFAGLADIHAQIQLVENKGQYPDSVVFAGNLPNGKVYFERNTILYDFYDFKSHHHEQTSLPLGSLDESQNDKISAHSYAYKFVNANQNPIISGLGKSDFYRNYFVGDKKQWASQVFDYQEVLYQELYDGIDFRYYKYGETVKYDFVIQPEADYAQIMMRISDPNLLSLQANGDLKITTTVNSIIETRPVAYQIVDGKKQIIASEFVLNSDIITFNLLEEYDPCHELIIDPTLIFSTYSGSTADNWGNTATYDEGGNLYSGGITSHYSGGAFPATSGAYQRNTSGFWDVAIIKYDSVGSNALFATYLGGSESELPQSLIVDNNNQLVILGATGSVNFPTQNAYQNTFNGGFNIEPFGGGETNVLFPNGSDIFITKLNASGTALLSSTYLGGTDNEALMAIGKPLTRNYGDQSRGDVLIKENGNIVVASNSASSDFPMQNAIQNSFSGGDTDAIIAEFTPDLSNLVFSSYLGGSGMDAAFTVKVNSQNKIIVGGGTNSRDVANFNDKFSVVSFGNIDGWLAIVDPLLQQLDTGVYIGTTDYDQLFFIDLDINENIYTYGQSAGNFPIQGNVFNAGGGQFLEKRSPDLSEKFLSTRFGSPGNQPDISPTAFLVNDCDNIYLSGWGGGTNSGYNGGNTFDMPITEDAFQSETRGSDFYLMALSTDFGQLLYGTYLGGFQSQTHVDGGTSRFDKRGIVYHAVCAGCGGFSSDFPATDNAFSTTNNSNNCNNAAFKFDLASLRAIFNTNSTAFDSPGTTRFCFPDDVVFENFSIGGEIYEWDFGDGTTLTTESKQPLVHQYNNPGLYRIKLKAIDPNTCIGEDETFLDVSITQPSYATIDDAEICEGTSFRLAAFGGTQYFWNNVDSTFLSQEATPVITPTTSDQYIVRITDDFGCEAIDTVRVDVVPEVRVDFTLSKINNCFSRPVISLVNKSEGGETYLWDFGDGNTSDLDELEYLYQEDGLYLIKLMGRNDFCVYEKQQLVEVNSLKIPNMFSPNGDATNETFEIIAFGVVDLKIFNRWGKLIYENDNYQNDWNAKDYAAGVYYYEATVGNEVTCNGWVQIFK